MTSRLLAAWTADRGMNADEVAQVVEASAPIDFLDRAVSNSKKWGRKCPPVRVG